MCNKHQVRFANLSSTLMYLINMEARINVEGRQNLEINKCGGWNKRGGWANFKCGGVIKFVEGGKILRKE